MKLGKKDDYVSRYKTKCGVIMEGCLTDFEHNVGLTYCPTPCPTCGKSHGWMPLRILAERIRI